MPDINGIPYVESTDLVSAYPAASQALAQEISDQLASKGDISTNGSWTAYTPTFSGGTWAVGNGTFSGVTYVQVGKIVFYKGTFTFGSTTVKDASAGLSLSLPVAGQAGLPGGGAVLFLDTGVAYYQGSLLVGGSSFTLLATTATIGQMVGVTTTSPFTWVTGDDIRWEFFYEAV